MVTIQRLWWTSLDQKYTSSQSKKYGGNNYYDGQLMPTTIAFIGADKPLQFSYPAKTLFFDVIEGTEVIYYPDNSNIHIDSEFMYLQLPVMTAIVTVGIVKQTDDRVVFTTPCSFTHVLVPNSLWVLQMSLMVSSNNQLLL